MKHTNFENVAKYKESPSIHDSYSVYSWIQVDRPLFYCVFHVFSTFSRPLNIVVTIFFLRFASFGSYFFISTFVFFSFLSSLFFCHHHSLCLCLGFHKCTNHNFVSVVQCLLAFALYACLAARTHTRSVTFLYFYFITHPLLLFYFIIALYDITSHLLSKRFFFLSPRYPSNLYITAPATTFLLFLPFLSVCFVLASFTSPNLFRSHNNIADYPPTVSLDSFSPSSPLSTLTVKIRL